MTTLQKTLITATIVAAAGAGFYEAHQASALRTQVQTLQRQQSSLSGQIQQLTRKKDDAPGNLSRSDARPVGKRFNWASVESSDYKQYIANLRLAGCPEETIRDIIRADVNKLYEEKKKDVRKAAPKFEYWKGDDFLRGVGRESWMKMLALDEERDAVQRALGMEPDHTRKEAKNATAMDWMLDFLGDEKKAQILRLHRELEDRLAMRAENSLDAQGIALLMKERDDTIKHLLNPEDALQYDLRMSGAAGIQRSQLAAFEPTEQEFITLFKLRKDHEEKFPNFPMVNPDDSSAAGRRARREAAAAGEQQLQEQIKQALGPERYADYQTAQDPVYQQMDRFAKQAGLGALETKQIYQARLLAEEQANRIQNDQGLTPEQRSITLQGIREETEKSIHTVLGEKGWEQFNRGGNGRWLDAINPRSVQ